jgi:DNA helicase-2/ATP-dependent DNA helicase PcrA
MIASEEDVIPLRRQRASAEGLEDERRLFYTALTRAKDTAILLYVDRRAGWPTEGASRFHREAGVCR